MKYDVALHKLVRIISERLPAGHLYCFESRIAEISSSPDSAGLKITSNTYYSIIDDTLLNKKAREGALGVWRYVIHYSKAPDIRGTKSMIHVTSLEIWGKKAGKEFPLIVQNNASRPQFLPM